MKKKYLSSKELVDKYNMSYSLLNYYTNLGLFKVKRRNGHTRLYDANEVRSQRTKINKLINAGYPLRLITKKLKA